MARDGGPLAPDVPRTCQPALFNAATLSPMPSYIAICYSALPPLGCVDMNRDGGDADRVVASHTSCLAHSQLHYLSNNLLEVCFGAAN